MLRQYRPALSDSSGMSQNKSPAINQVEEGSPAASTSARKRSTRACDGCKEKRLKCEDIRLDAASGRESCKLCREGLEQCMFTVPVRKRGPVPGSTRVRKRSRGEEDTPAEEDVRRGRPMASSSPVTTLLPTPLPPHAPELRGGHDARSRDTASRTISPPGVLPGTASRPSGRLPLLGLPRAMVDDLLAVYFTHVHNVWPLIYKPLFDIHTTSAPLLLAMISLAACVEPSIAPEGLDGAKLFAMAERSLHHCRMESRLDIVQSMILMSLRQTGCGDKGSAFLYAGRACTMALNLGLNLAPRPGSLDTDSEIESRSRTFWNAYVLDKTLSEETGRSFLLPYRRCSIPFPSLAETDEFETWPPLTMTSAPLPRSVRHIVPRRGYVLSCFTWTIRLGMIVEDILDLDVMGPPVVDPFDQKFADRRRAMRDTTTEAEGIADELRQWRQSLPKHLEVSDSASVSPLPHHIVGLSWWATASIQLYSRFMHRRAPQSSPVTHRDAMTSRAHQVCSEGARAVVDMLRLLEKHSLLHQLSSDVIHILSLATLFQAFDASDPDPNISQTAKADFERCCRWLKEFSGSWSAASSHKLFLEAVIQGGSSLAEKQGKGTPSIPDSPSNAVSSSLPEGLQVVQRNLSVAENTPFVSGPSIMLQLPGLYWNHLNLPAQPPTNPPSTMNPSVWSQTQPNPFDLSLSTPTPTALPLAGGAYSWQPQQHSSIDSTEQTEVNVAAGMAAMSEQGSEASRALDAILNEASTDTLDWSMFDLPFSSATPTAQPPPDQAAISAALMSYMANAAKGR